MSDCKPSERRRPWAGVAYMESKEQVDVAREIILSITDPAFYDDVAMASCAIAEHSHDLSRRAFSTVTCPSGLASASPVPLAGPTSPRVRPSGHFPKGNQILKQNLPAPLAEISPPFGETSEGDTGPSLRLRVAAGWGHLKRVLRRLDSGLIGDFLALICLAAMIYAFLVAGWVMS